MSTPSACRREIILSLEVAEKPQRELHSVLFFGDIRSFFPVDQKLSIQWRHNPGPYAMAQSPVHEMAHFSSISEMVQDRDIFTNTRTYTTVYGPLGFCPGIPR